MGSKRSRRYTGGRKSLRNNAGGGIVDDVRSWGTGMWNKVSSSVGYGPSSTSASSSYTSPAMSTAISAPAITSDISAPTTTPAVATSSDVGASGVGQNIGPYSNLGGRRRHLKMSGGNLDALATPVHGVPTARAHNWVGGRGRLVRSRQSTRNRRRNRSRSRRLSRSRR